MQNWQYLAYIFHFSEILPRKQKLKNNCRLIPCCSNRTIRKYDSCPKNEGSFGCQKACKRLKWNWMPSFFRSITRNRNTICWSGAESFDNNDLRFWLRFWNSICIHQNVFEYSIWPNGLYRSKRIWEIRQENLWINSQNYLLVRRRHLSFLAARNNCRRDDSKRKWKYGI